MTTQNQGPTQNCVTEANVRWLRDLVDQALQQEPDRTPFEATYNARRVVWQQVFQPQVVQGARLRDLHEQFLELTRQAFPGLGDPRVFNAQYARPAPAVPAAAGPGAGADQEPLPVAPGCLPVQPTAISALVPLSVYRILKDWTRYDTPLPPGEQELQQLRNWLVYLERLAADHHGTV